MNLERAIQEFQMRYLRINDFYQRRIVLAQDDPQLLTETLEELSVAVEELSVAQEELLIQNQELEQAYNRVETEHQRYRNLFDSAPDGYLVTDAVGAICEANRAAAELLKVSQMRLVGKPLIVFIPFQGRRNFRTKLNQLVKVEKVLEWELRLMPHQGKSIETAVTVSALPDEEGLKQRWLWVIRDISRRKQAEATNESLKQELKEQQQLETNLRQAQGELGRNNQKLQRLVNIDALTQIANRRRFDWVLQQEWQRLKREGKPLSLILFDVDYFKSYNDRHGHQSGDECLFGIAQAVEKAVYRPADLVARYGGEEFAIILPNSDCEGAIEVTRRIQKILKSLAIPHQQSQVSGFVTASFGIATLVPSREQTPEKLIARADCALYKAKQQGRNQYAIAD